jgi:hypothetical protein
MIGRQLDALNEMEDYLFSECVNDIDFTVVRPPRLLDTPLSGMNKRWLFIRYLIFIRFSFL